MKRNYKKINRLYNLILEYVLNNHIKFKAQAAAGFYRFSFCKYDDAKKVLSYIYKNYRKYYYLMCNCTRMQGAKMIYLKAFKNVINFEEDNILYHRYESYYYLSF